MEHTRGGPNHALQLLCRERNSRIRAGHHRLGVRLKLGKARALPCWTVPGHSGPPRFFTRRPNQINYLIPDGTAVGRASVNVGGAGEPYY